MSTKEHGRLLVQTNKRTCIIGCSFAASGRPGEVTVPMLTCYVTSLLHQHACLCIIYGGR